MNEKPVAMLVAALVVAPICATCILGPAIFGAAIGWFGGWLTGNGPLTAAGIAILVGFGALALQYRRRRRDAARQMAGNAAPPRWEQVGE